MNLLFDLLQIKTSKFKVKDWEPNFGFELNFIINGVEKIIYFGSSINQVEDITHFKKLKSNYYFIKHSDLAHLFKEYLFKYFVSRYFSLLFIFNGCLFRYHLKSYFLMTD